MRRRVVRDLGTILGIVVILVAVVLVNGYARRGTMAEQFDRMRAKVETEQAAKGSDLLSWELLRKTKGTKWTEPSYDKDLLAKKDTDVNLIGFMVPQYEFRQVTEFLLLPLPIECYFCQAPPMREVVLVEMKKDDKVDFVKEPVLISGNLTLNEGKGAKFFYVIKEASRGTAGQKTHRNNFTNEHIMHGLGAKQAEEAAKQPLLPGQEPPKAPTEPATK